MFFVVASWNGAEEWWRRVGRCGRQQNLPDPSAVERASSPRVFDAYTASSGVWR